MNRPEIDWTDIDAAEDALLALEKSLNMDEVWRALRLSIPAEILPQFDETTRQSEIKQWSIGARMAVRALRKQGSVTTARTPKESQGLQAAQEEIKRLHQRIRDQRAQLALLTPVLSRKEVAGTPEAIQAEMDNLRTQLSRALTSTRSNRLYDLEMEVRRQNRQNNRLRSKLADLSTELEILDGVPRPLAPDEMPQKDWDYATPLTRPAAADELPTDVPFHVQTTARQVEEYLGRSPDGRMTKPEVSAALPDSRAYLAAAYKHLHLCNRVRVDGWTLQKL